MNISICFCSDNNYAQHLAVALVSILKNSDKTDEFSFFVLDAGIKDENKNKISELKKIKSFQIEYITIDMSLFKTFPDNSTYISAASYARLLISSLLKTIDKIIYLDCDLVVCHSLRELFNENIDDYHLAGVEDIYYYHTRRELKRDTESFYANSGVMLINLNKWRQDNIEEKLLAVPKNTAMELVHRDQDIINIVLNKTIKPLDLKWNVMDCFFRVANYMEIHPLKKDITAAWRFPCVIHYTGLIKPWNKPYMPAGDLYMKYLKYTPFQKEYEALAAERKPVRKYLYDFKNRIYYFIRYLISPVIAVRRFKDSFGVRLFMLFFLKIKKLKIEKTEKFPC